ncbi:MAG: glycosyltransferase family 4 protein [Bacteriovoracales bacterium]
MGKKPPKQSSTDLSMTGYPSAPVKVVHLITLLELGGAQGNTIHTVRNLNEEKFDTYLWAGRGAYWDHEVEKDLGRKGKLLFLKSLVRDINPFLDVIALLSLWWRLKKIQPLILHTHSSKAGILGRIAGNLAGVPIIIHTFHGFGFNDQQKPWTKWLFILLERLTAKVSTKLLFVSVANMTQAKELKIGRPEQYALIRSGVALQSIRKRAGAVSMTDLKKKLMIPPDANLITTIGAFKPQKNLLDFIQVAQSISKKSSETHFLIIGDGEMRVVIEKLIAELNLETKVHLLGWREDIPELLTVSNVFVLTSLWEGLPRALIESLSIGIPSVCYDTDGVRDILSKGGGEIIPRGDMASMVSSIIELLNNKTLWNKLSQEAKNIIGQDFDIEEMVHQQENLYLSLLNLNNLP